MLETKITRYFADVANRVGGFELLPTQLLLPNITTQPIDGFQQYTWITTAESEIGDVVPLALNPINNTIDMSPGTEFSLNITLSTDDVQTLNRYPFDVIANLSASYKWKRDDGYLYEYNSLNDGKGSSTLFVPSSSCTIDISGVYVCEITNGYGTVETEPVTINVLNIDTHPLLYKNLILNGDGNLNGWTADFDIKTSAFVGDIYKSKNFGSYRLADSYMVLSNLDETVTPTDETDLDPPNFYFCIDGGYNLFPSILKNKKGITNINIDQIPLQNISNNNNDFNTSGPILPQIIPNEDFNYNSANSQYAGFYPGPYAIDNYNQNQNLIGLVEEFNTGPNFYFTRDKIKFEKFGGTSVVKMSQTIDIIDVGSLVDGRVYGVNELQGQFFAYVGAGITGYDITYINLQNESVTINGYGLSPQELALKLLNTNFAPPNDFTNNVDALRFLLDSSFFVQRLDQANKLNPSDLYNIIQDLKIPYNKWQNLIEEDSVTISYNNVFRDIVNVLANALGYQLSGDGTNWIIDGNADRTVSVIANNVSPFDLFNIAIQRLNNGINNTNLVNTLVELINTIDSFNPNVLTAIQEVKEGTDIVITPRVDDQTEIVVSFIDSNNTVISNTVFNGPTAEEVWAIKEKVYFAGTLFTVDNVLNAVGNPIKVFGKTYCRSGVGVTTDYNNLLKSKFKFEDFGGSYPNTYWWLANNKKNTHLIDRGAAAMFGVGGIFNIPAGTRSIKITVYFKHLSGIDKDVSPELRGWSSQEIYDTDYINDNLTSAQLAAYGNPRCGITKMKLILGANNIEESSKYISYRLPPRNQTIVGRSLSRSNIPDYHYIGTAVYKNIFSPFNDGAPTTQNNVTNVSVVAPALSSISITPNLELDLLNNNSINIVNSLRADTTMSV